MFDPKLIGAQLDGRVLAALMSCSPDESIEAVAATACTDTAGLRRSMTRLGTRQPGVDWPWAGVSEYDHVPPLWWPAQRLARMV